MSIPGGSAIHGPAALWWSIPIDQTIRNGDNSGVLKPGIGPELTISQSMLCLDTSALVGTGFRTPNETNEK